MPESAIPAYITSIIRHFEDLRDGTHGGSASRKDKEAHFEKAVYLLAPIARQVLTEMNTSLLLDTGQFTETGLRRTTDGGLNASWALSWPEQRAAGVQPIMLQAYFGGGFHHVWSRWAEVLVVVKPETVVGWHRAGFRLFWRWRSRRRGGRA